MAVPTQFAFRTSKGLGVVNAAPTYEPLPGFEKPEGNLRCCSYSPCGRYFAWATLDAVLIIDASIGYVISTLPAQNVYELGFSPLGTYIITWQRPSKDDNGDAVKNLKVWRVIEGPPGEDAEHNVVGRFVQKSQTGWNLQYTFDEKYCARVVTNEIQIYESQDLGTVWNKLRVEGVTDFAVSPGKNHSIAVFIPERKGSPASVKVYNVPQFDSAVSQKNFFKGDKVQLKWNDEGTSLIVLAQTEVDRSGKSYYGETTLYLLSANGGFDSRIDLDKEGPIHDVAWSPKSQEFGVVYGYMPAKTTIFNTRAEAVHSFALGPRNTILFSPHGRFVLVAGFGNLAGQMDIYDLEKDSLKVCTIEASNASVCQWSPDGKYILTATTSPRLRVDNGIRIWHAGGGIMYNEDMQELYHVNWRPQSATSHPLENPLHPVPTPHASALSYLGTVKTPSKPAGAYRPPGARGTSTPLAFKREDEGGTAHVRDGLSFGSANNSTANGFGKPRRREVPGAEPVAEDKPPVASPAEGDENLSKAALKNKKKREAKKAKDAAEKSANLAAPSTEEAGAPPIAGRSRSQSRGASSNSRDRRGHERNRSRADSELRPRSQQGRPRTNSQRRDFRDGDPRDPAVREASAAAARAEAEANGHQDSPKKTRGQKNQANGNQKTPQIDTSIAQASNKANGAGAAPEAPGLTVTSPGGGGSPQEKKVRALTKKLRAIDDLKMRRAGGESLEATQVQKMDTEESVRRELENLGWTEL
ncbi:hypothetical protein MMC25_005083 [Agyrium rufum]|nr:hypothetical protein [Agyrium rufum]